MAMSIRPVLALLLFVSATSLLPAQSGDSPYVIHDVRVFDGETVAERQTVVISQGRITAVLEGGRHDETGEASIPKFSGQARAATDGTL
jgi:hypothetical protein